MTNREINLEPCECPYCGSFKVARMGTTRSGEFWIQCKKCNAQGPKCPTLPGAVREWNKINGGIKCQSDAIATTH
mgnify:CR=1 FL=1